MRLALEVVKRVAFAFSCVSFCFVFCTTTGLEWILTLDQTGGRSGKESQNRRSGKKGLKAKYPSAVWPLRQGVNLL